MVSIQSVVQLTFDFLPKLPVVVETSAAQLSSDAGLLAFRQLDERIGLTQAFAAALDDPRAPHQVDHTFLEMTRSRIYGILAGYEDQNDHDILRSDPVFKLIANRSPAAEPLASQPTLSRFENLINISSLKRLRDVLIDQFLASFAEPPSYLTFDFDAVDDPAHGAQQLVLFHGFYEQYQYLPLVVTCAQNDHIVLLSLRPGSVHAALGADDDLDYLVRRIRAVWPNVVIHIRGDAGFGMPWMLTKSEQLGVEYSFGLASNAVLKRRSEALLEEAVAAYEKDRQQAKQEGRPLPPTRRLFDAFWYQAGSWPAPRWVIVKAEANAQGSNRRFVLSNRPGAPVLPEAAYDAYAERGEGENRNKEFKCGLAMDRLSDHRFLANFFRLYLHAAALNLVVQLRQIIALPLAVHEQAVDALTNVTGDDAAVAATRPPGEILRQHGLTEITEDLPAEALPEPARRRYFDRRRRHDPLGEGQPATWRLLFIKIAAEVIVSKRRIRIQLSRSWPYLHYFQKVCQRLLQGLQPASHPTG
jgi:Transposase DDE domain group 1